MRYIRYICIAIFAVALIVVALANREVVTLKVLPRFAEDLFAVNPSIDMPLFLVIFAGIIVGLAAGIVGEWLREYSIRRDAGRATREVRRLEREIARLKGEKHKGQDEVLALLDDAG